MAALAIGTLALSAISGIAGYFQAEKARKASKERLDKIEALFNRIKPPGYDLSIEAPPEMHKLNLEKNFASELPKTKFDKKLITAVGQYLPQFPKMVKEEAPQLLKETETTKKGKEAQEKALKEFQRIADQTNDPKFRLLVERAKKRAQSEAQSRGETLKTQMARRGLAGSGLEIASNIGSNAEAMDRLADIEMQAAADAYRNRLEALARGSEIGRSLSQQDLEKQRYNLDLINQFNRRMSDREQRLEEMRAAGMNEAQLRNLGERQRLSELNRRRADTIASREAEEARADVNRSDRLKMWSYGQRMANRDRANMLRRQMYEDELSRARGMAGLADTRNQYDFAAARDKINAFNSMADAGSKGLSLIGSMYGDNPKVSEVDKYRRRFNPYGPYTA